MCDLIISALTLNGPQAISLARFIVNTFKSDEEMQKIHLPICFAGLLELISVSYHGKSGFRN